MKIMNNSLEVCFMVVLLFSMMFILSGCVEIKKLETSTLKKEISDSIDSYSKDIPSEIRDEMGTEYIVEELEEEFLYDEVYEKDEIVEIINECLKELGDDIESVSERVIKGHTDSMKSEISGYIDNFEEGYNY